MVVRSGLDLGADLGQCPPRRQGGEKGCAVVGCWRLVGGGERVELLARGQTWALAELAFKQWTGGAAVEQDWEVG